VSGSALSSPPAGLTTKAPSTRRKCHPGKDNGTILSASGIRHPASGIRHPASGIRHPASGIRHPASGIRHPAFVI